MLYEKYYGFVSGICLRYLKEEALARETVNDIFLKLFTKISLYDAAKASLITWLRTIAVHTCLDKMKLSSFENKILSLDSEAATADFTIDDTHTAENILELMDDLPKRQRAIFNLFIVEGYAHDEIGKMLGISAGNSRWYLNDAKQRIRNALTQTGYKIK